MLFKYINFVSFLLVSALILTSSAYAQDASTDASPPEAVSADVAPKADKPSAVQSLGEDATLIKGIAQPWQIHYQEAATPVMERLSNLHNYILIIVSAIMIFVTCLLAYTCIRFRKRAHNEISQKTHSTLFEISVWTIPALILIAIFIPSLDLHYYMDEAQAPDMTLKVTGYQWYWGYSYPDQEVDEYLSYMKPDEDLKVGEPRLLAADNPLVVPVGTTIRVLVTGADVIHSFAMPAFGVKSDCIPGRLNETWFRVEKPGIYYGQCSELCGVKHGFMPIEIRAVEKDVFTQWVERAKTGEYALDGLSIPADNKVASVTASENDKASLASVQQNAK